MLNPQNETNDITDTLNGSLTTWYSNVDSALKASECVPGYYEYAQAPSYGTQCPVNEGGSTRIDIAGSRFDIISIDNSYIDVEFEVPINIPRINADANSANTDGGGRTEDYIYYVGFKSAFDLIDSYRIYSNGDLVYTQNHANFESFINYISLTDQAKENSACFATLSKIQAIKPNVPGTYIRIEGEQRQFTFTANIKLKIPLNAFLMLSNLKWFPGFMGRLTIEIYPTYKNLVWCKIDNMTDKLFGNNGVSHTLLVSGAGGNEAVSGREWIYQIGSFSQINSSCYNAFTYNAGGGAVWDYDEQTFTANTSTLKKFHLYLAKYMLKMDVYNQLEYNYLQFPLLFPIQTVTNVKFTSALGQNSHFTLQNTATLSHCDTIFVVFPWDVNSRTCFTNPEISSQLNINGKYYPREAYSTVNDPRFFNMELDALNINNNPLVSISDDVNTSINPYLIYTTYDQAGASTYRVFESRCDQDRSNFFIGVPLSTDEDFMGGISSNGSTVQVELVGDRNSVSADVNQENWTQPPEAIFLEDKLLKIYSMKPQGRKQIDITNATLEQIAAGA